MSKHQQIFRAGNSLAVSLPSNIVKKLGLAVGQTVICTPSIDDNKITYDFPDAKQLPLLGSQKNKSHTQTKK